MNTITELAAVLRGRGWRLATAESLTGGGIGAALTTVPGSSEWFAGGAIVYQTDQKTRQLGVPREIIERCGVVSREVVAAMARGVGERFAAEVSIAVSGVAGPDGGSVDTPVGTVWIAVVTPDASKEQKFHFMGSRAEVRQQTIEVGIAIAISTFDISTPEVL